MEMALQYIAKLVMSGNVGHYTYFTFVVQTITAPHGPKLTHRTQCTAVCGTGRHFHILARGPFVSLMHPSELR